MVNNAHSQHANIEGLSAAIDDATANPAQRYENEDWLSCARHSAPHLELKII